MSEYLRIPLTADQKKLIDQAAQFDLSDTAPWARALLLRAAQERVAAGKADRPRRK
jgi:hypothetical protein